HEGGIGATDVVARDDLRDHREIAARAACAEQAVGADPEARRIARPVVDWGQATDGRAARTPWRGDELQLVVWRLRGEVDRVVIEREPHEQGAGIRDRLVGGNRIQLTAGTDGED